MNRNAIILAAGKGERCVPLTYETPKGLLSVFGKPAIEWQIEQLHEVGVTDITIVTGYMKEKFDYLVDKYGVSLVYNEEYNTKNNLASLYVVKDRLASTYICVSDNYMSKNIFSKEENASWFSGPFFEDDTEEWIVSKTSEDGAFKELSIGGRNAYAIQGPAYFSAEFSKAFVKLLEEYYAKPESADYYWEHILLFEMDKLPAMYNKDTTGIFYEFECLEELRELDESYKVDTHNKIMRHIADVFGVSQGDIYGLKLIKTGMNNNSFKFSVNNKSYIYRLSGHDMPQLVSRSTEYEILKALAPYGITDKLIYFNPENGTKISEYLEDVHMSDPYSDKDLKEAMQRVRTVHELKLHVDAEFDIESVTYHYVRLAKDAGAPQCEDFEETLDKMNRLFELRKKLAVPEYIIHGDCAHVNMLMLPDNSARIIDWEFGMNGDPISDVAQYALFAEFDKKRLDKALKYYLGREPEKIEYLRLYMYTSIYAFRWSEWAKYKEANGAVYGDYVETQYGFAKDYYDICIEIQKEMKL